MINFGLKELQKRHPKLQYLGFKTKITNKNKLQQKHFLHIKNWLKITHLIKLCGEKDIIFKPKLFIPSKHKFFVNSLKIKEIKHLIEFIGLVECLSYWKAACPKIWQIDFFLNYQQKKFFKKLLKFGLGEFFYINGINPKNLPIPKIFEKKINFKKNNKLHSKQIFKNQTILPIGGGKDSCVSLNILKNRKIIPFFLNEDPAAINCAKAAGFDEQNCLIFYRSIDKKLLKLNKLGYLNGHTPFSALLAFICLLAAQLTDSENIALSNEASASEASVHQTKINHQYSKTLEFENNFRIYAKKFINNKINYFSLLRPLNELQIIKNFSNLKTFHPHFRSCNIGSKKQIWCGNCSKCLFVALLLSSFIKHDKIDKIFAKKNPLDNKNLSYTLEEILGLTKNKPFDCVGSINDSRCASALAINNYQNQLNKKEIAQKPILIKKIETDPKIKKILPQKNEISQFLKQFNKNNLNKEFRDLIKKHIFAKHNKIDKERKKRQKSWQTTKNFSQAEQFFQ